METMFETRHLTAAEAKYTASMAARLGAMPP
jgi:hypothetical protein